MRKLGKPIDTGATVTVNADTGLNVNDFTVNYYKVVGEIKPGEEIKTEETPTQKPTETGKYVSSSKRNSKLWRRDNKIRGDIYNKSNTSSKTRDDFKPKSSLYDR